MKARLLLCSISACLLLSGCPSSSVYPLYTDQDAVVEPALEGMWSSLGPDENEEFLFRKSGDHEYSLTIFCADTKVTQNYEVHLVRLGGQLFMDLIFKDQAVDGAEVDDPLGVVSTHVIAKVNISGDDLAYATLEDDAIRNQSVSGATPLDYQMANGSMLVTTQTEALRLYISAHAEDVFSDFEHLQRRRETSIREFSR
ncbi:MAG TPA: hypothetical protein VEJ67_00680 [Candidatus Cybelea sp.]|nr:hypothetical protein [Candidatus Cybelea sp.]